jgi:hypothetical protein
VIFILALARPLPPQVVDSVVPGSSARSEMPLRLAQDEGDLDRLRRAVERAQLESRRVISAAAAPGGQPFEVALAEAAAEVAERYHVSWTWISPPTSGCRPSSRKHSCG